MLSALSLSFSLSLSLSTDTSVLCACGRGLPTRAPNVSFLTHLVIMDVEEMSLDVLGDAHVVVLKCLP